MSQEAHVTCPPGIDGSFGPWAGDQCRGGFDFTLVFEEAILTIPLQCALLLILPIRSFFLASEKTRVVASPLNHLKIGFSICLVTLTAVLLALHNTVSPSSLHTRTSTPAAALVFVASLGLGFLSWLEHQRTIRPSFTVSTYLFLSTLLDLPRVRTLWMLDHRPTAIPVVFTCAMAVKIVMYILESTEKRSILISDLDMDDLAKETTSSTLSRVSFFWLMSLFLKGYNHILKLEDLYALDPALHSKALHAPLSEAWAKAPDKLKFGALWVTWHRTFILPWLAPVIPKLFQIAFTYSQPFLINVAIALAYYPEEQPFTNYGYGLIGAYVLVYMGIAISTGQYEWHVYRAVTTMRGSIVALIYENLLHLDINSPSVSPEGALTLFNTDCETIIHGIMHMHELWAGIVEVFVGIYLISRQLGAAAAMPVVIVVVVMISTIFVAVPTGKAQAIWIQASQDRVTATSKLLGSIKSVKASGLNDLAFGMIREARTEELKISRKCRLLLGAALIMVVCIPVWVPILTFCVYAGLAERGNTTLNISRAFTSYALFILVNKPLSDIIIALPMIATSVASFGRIQEHLNGKQRVDIRTNISSSTNDDEKLSKPPSEHLEKVQDSHESPEEGFLSENLSTPQVNEKSSAGEVIASLQGKFSWKVDEKPVIDINELVIYRQNFTMVVGPVGSGKTTLLKCLLGELSDFDGTIQIDHSRVAYCAQNPWLPNDTVRNIIAGLGDIDESWYHTVVKACALEQDIRDWPLGDETVAGAKGISMSGGQKHRLSIARALYSKADFLIFDDCFSGLDSTTENKIFHNLLDKDGLIRRAKMALIVASSSVRRVFAADQVILLSGEGKISDSGTPAQLHKTLAQFGEDGHQSEVTDTENFQDAPNATAQSAAAILPVIEPMPEDNRRLGSPGMYSFYAKSVGFYTLSIFFVAMIIFAFSNSFPNIWLNWWAEANARNPNGDLGKWLGVYIALGIGAVIATVVAFWQIFIVAISKSGFHFHDLLLDTTSRAPMSFHAKVDSGITINRFSQDLQLIDMELPSTALGVAIGLSFVIADFIMVAISSRYMAVFLPFLIIVFYFVQRFYLRTSRQIRLLDIELRAPLYTHFMHTLDGLSSIRAFQWGDDFTARNIRLLDDSQKANYLLYCIQRWLTFVIDVFIAIVAVVLIVIITTLRTTIGPGYVGIAASNILGLNIAMKATLSSWVAMEVVLGAVARIKTYTMETESEDNMNGTSLEPKDGKWPTEGAVELIGVTASYDTSRLALSNVSLKINPGEKVALCGRTGSGKTSLTLCLLRMLELEKGSIKIDNTDISTLAHQFVRSHLVSAPQDSYTFNATVRINLDPAKTASDEEINLVLDKLHMLQNVNKRGGLDAVMSDNFFSQGEAQLFVFARAMLRKGKILILDEVSSSLDTEASKTISEMLRTWFKGWTVIAVVHKLDTIFDYDKVGVLDAGTLKEFDSPERLLEREDSLFKALYAGMPRDSRDSGRSHLAKEEESSVGVAGDDETLEKVDGSSTDTEINPTTL